MSYNSPEYRYGFNGMEKDDEVKGSGNSLDFGARIYDPRLSRWLSRDPLYEKYTSWSPYNGMLNNPIRYQDIDGRDVDDKAVYAGVKYGNYYGYVLFTRTAIAQNWLRNFSNGNDTKLPGFENGSPGKYANHTFRIFPTPTGKVRGGVAGTSRTFLKTDNGSEVKLENVTAADVENSSLNFTFEVDIVSPGAGEESSSIGHEVFVHSEVRLNQLEALKKLIASGVIASTDYEAIATKLNEIGVSHGPEAGAYDHANIVVRTNDSYELFKKELLDVAGSYKEIIEEDFKKELDKYKNSETVKKSIDEGKNTLD